MSVTSTTLTVFELNYTVYSDLLEADAEIDNTEKYKKTAGSSYNCV